jgi:hypothetical protein
MNPSPITAPAKREKRKKSKEGAAFRSTSWIYVVFSSGVSGEMTLRRARLLRALESFGSSSGGVGSAKSILYPIYKFLVNLIKSMFQFGQNGNHRFDFDYKLEMPGCKIVRRINHSDQKLINGIQ